MTAETRAGRGAPNLLGALPVAASVFSLAIAALALAGWALDLPSLRGVSPRLVAMNPMTAIGLSLAALSLVALRRRGASALRRRAGIAAAVGTAAIGALRLAEAAGLTSAAVDRLLFPQLLAAGRGRMVPSTAFCLLLLGAGLALLDWRRRVGRSLRLMPGTIALAAAAAISSSVFVAYSYLGSILLLPGAVSGMALNTAACLVALTLGALASRPDRGLIALLTSDGEAGALARRLILWTTVLPLALGWLRYAGQMFGWYPVELGIAFMAVGTILLLALVVWAAASSVGRAVAARRSALDALSVSERRFRELFVESPSSIWTHDGAGTLTTVNPTAAAALGYSREEMTGRRLSDFLSPESAARFEEHLTALRHRGRQEELIDVVTRAGEERTWLYTQRWIEEEVAVPFALGHALDVTQRQQAERRMAHQAFHDALTGIANRALFDDRLAQSLAHAERHGSRLAVFFLDLDGFKPINDAYGHAAGDRVLHETALRLARSVRQEDTVARRGGDEFALLLVDIDHADAVRIGENLLALIASPVEHDGELLHVTGSLGISFYPESAATPEALLQAADRALYRSKAEGRGQINLSFSAGQPLPSTAN